MSQLQSLFRSMSRPTDGASLAAFRIFFGAICASQAFNKYWGDIDKFYAPGELHFHYPLFDWVAPWPGFGMQIHMFVMAVAALGIMTGFFYRFCAIIYLLCYSFVFLIEQATYNNHYYLIVLLAFLFCLVDGHACAAVDTLRKPRATPGLIPSWHVVVFRLQFVVIYFYGGLAKVNEDWLRGEPMRHWLENRQDYAVVGQYFTEEWCIYFFAYGGLCFDLLIGFLLLWRKTRLMALVPFAFFHLMNNWLFTIGIFPFLALGGAVVFLETDTPRRWLRFLGVQVASPGSKETQPVQRFAVAVILAFFAAQCLVPLRHHLYEGNVSWNEAGHTFAWHMKLRDKKARGTFTVVDGETEERFEIGRSDQRKHLGDTRRRRMLVRPHMILQYAHFLRDQHAALGVADPMVYAEIRASLNGRPYQPLIDPEVNLAHEEYTLFGTPAWVIPLPRDLPIGIYP